MPASLAPPSVARGHGQIPVYARNCTGAAVSCWSDVLVRLVSVFNVAVLAPNKARASLNVWSSTETPPAARFWTSLAERYVCGPTFLPTRPMHGKNTAVKPSLRRTGTALYHGLRRPSSNVITTECGGKGNA